MGQLPDVFIWWPSDATAGLGSLRSLHKTDVPVLKINQLPNEQDSIRILDMVRRLSERGKSIIYVSHRLDEIFKITDRITVLRDGESQALRTADYRNVNSLVELMLGRELDNMFPERRSRGHGEPLVQVRDLWPDGLLEPVNFDIYPGEILGLAGQLGSGSGEILAAMGGALKTRACTLTLSGQSFLPSSPKEAIAEGIAYCSGDRKLDGLFLGRPIKENLSSPALGSISRPWLDAAPCRMASRQWHRGKIHDRRRPPERRGRCAERRQSAKGGARQVALNRA